MDFDDLDDNEAAAGPTMEERREELAAGAEPDAQEFPFPSGKNFGEDGKMKMLFLHGGGTNSKIGMMQVSNVFKEVPFSKTIMSWTVWTGPHQVPLGWNGDFSLQPYGPDFTVYFERWPFANCQWETWDGIEKSFAEFKEHLKEHGPYDGVCGFDMGGEFLVHVARKAQEGDPDFKGAFRFMVLFTTGSSKHLSPMGNQRPKAQLRIPAIISWCDGDQNHPYQWYEETVLFFHKDYREVIRHKDGHKPPRILKDTSEHHRLVRFMDAMRNGRDFLPSDHEDNQWCRDLFLPLKRVEQEKSQSGGAKKLLVVPDPMGAHDLEARLIEMKYLREQGKLEAPEPKPFVVGGTPPKLVEGLELKLAVCTMTSAPFAEAAGSDLQVDTVEYDPEDHVGFNWHCKPDQVPSPQLFPEDIIDNEGHDQISKFWAGQLVEKYSLEEDDEVGIVGLGTGSMIALALGKYFIKERKHTPSGLWLVNPPMRLPWCTTEKPCGLLDCPVHVLTYEYSTYGPGWRYEVSTCGPFTHSIFKDTESLVKTIVDEFKAS